MKVKMEIKVNKTSCVFYILRKVKTKVCVLGVHLLGVTNKWDYNPI